MRILFVTAGFLPEHIGGVELHVRGVALAMAAAGHEVSVFCRRADPSRPEFDVERDEVDAIPVTRLNYLFGDCTDFETVYRNPRIRARFAEELARVRPDVVHVHHLTCLSTDLIDAAKDVGARVVVTLHDFWMGCPRGQRMTPELELCHTVDAARCAVCLPKMWGGWFGHGRDVEQIDEYHAWIRGVLHRADALVTPSESSRALFDRQGVPAASITVVENGLDHAPLAGVAAARAPSDTFRFGFIGSVLPTKGVHVLLDAFGRLGGDVPARLDVHGELLGWHEVTDYADRVRAQAAALGDGVTLHGRYEAGDLPGILASLDALVVPSLWFEAFCLTLREGFLAGVPMIVSDLGLRFEVGNAADLADKMARVRDDADLRRRLVESEKRVRTIEENARHLLELYGGRSP